MAELEFELSARHAGNIFGQLDRHLRKIEQRLGISVLVRGDLVRLTGDEIDLKKAEKLFQMLLALSERGNTIEDQNVEYCMSLLKDHEATAPKQDAEQADPKDMILSMDSDTMIHTMSGRAIKPKTIGQKEYVDSIRNKMITFGIGPAGTGKTYLAMAMAIRAFRAEEVSRIILTRPAIEAGEKLGFLPGDLQSKIDPYLRPLYDALYEIMGAENYLKNAEKGLIEVAPLAYMRGRTLDNAFIILDEAQNTTPAQMKMFLTRIGFGSKVVITGDRTQKDLPSDMTSGLDVAARVLGKIDEIGFCELSSKDVVRHPLVQKIVQAYETYEKHHSGEARQKRTIPAPPLRGEHKRRK